MRNLLEYPITPQECIEWLEAIRPQYSYETTGRIGDMSMMYINYMQMILYQKMIADC